MSKKAVVYTGKLCSWCDRVKQLLKDEGYEIEDAGVRKPAEASKPAETSFEEIQGPSRHGRASSG